MHFRIFVSIFDICFPLICFSQISRLQIGDSGTYQCIVKTDDGADYIETTLSVKGDCHDYNRESLFFQGFQRHFSLSTLGRWGWDSLCHHFSAVALILKAKVSQIRYYSIIKTHTHIHKGSYLSNLAQSRDLTCPQSLLSLPPASSPPAPYKTVNKYQQKAADGEQLLLTCQSEGHPRTAAVWRDGHAQAITSNTSFELTPQQLFKASSQIHVPSALRNNYTCSFPHGGNSATFHITGET